MRKFAAILLLVASIVLLLDCRKDKPAGQSSSNGGNPNSGGNPPVNPPPAGLRPPVADAGRDTTMTLPQPEIVLDGRRSYDPDTNIVKYKWTIISGQVNSLILDPDSAKASCVLLSEGIYSFELKVTDATGLSDADTVVVTLLTQVGCYSTPNNCGGYWICTPADPFKSLAFGANPGFIGAFGAATAAGSKMYFAGGHEEGYIGGAMPTVSVYNATTNTWTEALMSVGRSHLAAASCGTKVFFAGGNNFYTIWSPPPYGINPEYYKVVDIFDINGGEPATAQLSEGRSNLATASTTDKCFFIGGLTATGYSSKMDIYNNTTGSWSVVELPRGRADAGAVVANNKVYITGGKGAGGPLTVVDVFDITAQSWSTLEMPNMHPVAAVALVGNKIIVAGGDGLESRNADIYDLVSGVWTTNQLSDSRFNMAVGVANNKAIFMGGHFSCNVDVYDGATGSWSVTHLNQGVEGVSAASLSNKTCFTGFLYSTGYSLTNTAMIIEP